MNANQNRKTSCLLFDCRIEGKLQVFPIFVGWFRQDYGISKYTYSAIELAGAAILKTHFIQQNRTTKACPNTWCGRNSSEEGSGLKISVSDLSLIISWDSFSTNSPL